MGRANPLHPGCLRLLVWHAFLVLATQHSIRSDGQFRCMVTAGCMVVKIQVAVNTESVAV